MFAWWLDAVLTLVNAFLISNHISFYHFLSEFVYKRHSISPVEKILLIIIL